LDAAEQGDLEAAESLVPIVYEELKGIAHAQLRRLPPGQTLQTTALVHEAYLRLTGGSFDRDSGTAYFFGAAARAMRFVLVDRARRKSSQKRGGDRQRLDDEWIDRLGTLDAHDELLDLNEALDRLEREDPRKAQVVTLRFFAGLEMSEVATALEMPLRTVEREWRFARAWLKAELSGGGGPRE
jgi:RNA polymerase sigma factor (TIGR02999 family)